MAGWRWPRRGLFEGQESRIQKFLAFLKANAFVTVLTLSSSVGLWYFLQRDVLELEVLQHADVRIVTIDSALGSGVQVLLAGRQVSAVRALDIEVRNSGNRPILREDFDLPLTLTFRGRIAGDVTVLSAFPSALPVVARVELDSVLAFEPLLLNPRDAFTVRVLLADNALDDARPTITGRIVGVSRLVLQLHA